MSRNWQELAINENESMQALIRCIDNGAEKIALVTNESGQLVGTASDGDIRRALLKGANLDSLAKTIMNPKPLVLILGEPIAPIHDQMRERRITLVPVVDRAGRLVAVEHLDSSASKERDNIVVLMAGGRGTRLMPFTESLPKPLLKIGNQPILELIMQRLAEQGFRRFAISIHYLGSLIRSHFGDGSRLGVHIDYLEEERPLGTCGALSLIPGQPASPIIVMNGDLLTNLRMDWLLDYHLGQNAVATMAVREYDFAIPFGVVEIDDGLVSMIKEKPVHKLFVNAGIYALDPKTLRHIAPDTYLDMPTFLSRLRDAGERVAAFAMRERWLDIGRPEDFQRAEVESQVLTMDKLP